MKKDRYDDIEFYRKLSPYEELYEKKENRLKLILCILMVILFLVGKIAPTLY